MRGFVQCNGYVLGIACVKGKYSKIEIHFRYKNKNVSGTVKFLVETFSLKLSGSNTFVLNFHFL